MVRYIASLVPASELMGQNDIEAAQVDSWLSFIWHSIELPICAYIEEKTKLSATETEEGPNEGIMDGIRSKVGSAMMIVERHLRKQGPTS